MEINEIIANNAAFMVRYLERNNVPNDYGMQALQYLEDDIDTNREHMNDQLKANLLNSVGAYLGECICRAYNGKWIKHEHGLGIDIDDGKVVVFPFAKVGKWLHSGDTGDSFVSMFRSIPGILNHVNQPKDKGK